NSVLTLSRRGTAQAGLRLRCAFCHLNHFMPEFASGGGENETTMAHRRGPACGVPSRFGGGRKSFPLATSANSVGVHAAPCAPRLCLSNRSRRGAKARIAASEAVTGGAAARHADRSPDPGRGDPVCRIGASGRIGS